MVIFLFKRHLLVHEGERAFQMERQKATLAIANLGSKEMSLKGIGNVEEGVKKITGISIASAGQLIVRGLGDRYRTTCLLYTSRCV